MLLSGLARRKTAFSGTGSPTQYRWQEYYSSVSHGEIFILYDYVAFPGFVLLPDLEWNGWILAEWSRP